MAWENSRRTPKLNVAVDECRKQMTEVDAACVPSLVLGLPPPRRRTRSGRSWDRMSRHRRCLPFHRRTRRFRLCRCTVIDRASVVRPGRPPSDRRTRDRNSRNCPLPRRSARAVPRVVAVRARRSATGAACGFGNGHVARRNHRADLRRPRPASSFPWRPPDR